MSGMQLYGAYQRLWHWTQAVTILLLIISGIVIHLPSRVALLSFAVAVQLHNLAAFLLLANAVMGLFYYLTSGEIRQLLPQSRGLGESLRAQSVYYLKGIFQGDQHPHARTASSRLNPLQKITYVIVLNIMLPLQVLTGLLMWGAQRWPELVASIGGMRVLASAHSLGAWLFTAFLIMHLYLITTGRTPVANLQTMLTGWEALEAEQQRQSARSKS